MVCRAVHEAPRQDIDGGVERRGEQHPLAAGRRHVKQPPHDGQESEVGHVVRLVDHAYFHVAKVTVALLDEIGQPARTRDDDIGAVAKLGHLWLLGHSAVDRRNAQPRRFGERREDGMDLAGEFPGRHQHQAARAAALV